MIFDAARHCFDGLVCGDFVTPDDSELKSYSCSCGKSTFRVSLDLEMEDREQFIEEVVAEHPDKFSADDYVNALNWIAADLHCDSCGEDISEWISLEGC